MRRILKVIARTPTFWKISGVGEMNTQKPNK